MHNGESLNILQDNLDKLQILFPDIFSEGKIDFEKFKANFSDDINFNNERYVLNWAGKADAFKVLQIPTTATLKPLPEESINFDSTQNIFIEGENLEVLKVLQKSYYNKIKCIIIDPPYNTGNDSFIYPDSFKENKADYEKRIGEKDEEGLLMKEGLFRKNSKDSGHYHSNWLSMMYPRLFLAKNLLKDDGVIFVHIDDNEVHNLRLLMNEIFGEENFVAQIVWSNKEGGGSSDSKLFRIKHEYIIAFGKKIEEFELAGVEISNRERYTLSDDFVNERGPYYLQKLGMGSIQYSTSLDYPIETPDKTFTTPIENNSNKKACWRWSKTKLKWGIENKFVEFKKDKNNIWIVYTKQYLKCDNNGKIIERTQRPFGVIDSYSSTQASKFLDEIGLNKMFDYSKPVELIKYLLKLSLESEEIVLDFFAGSGTAAQAVLELNKEDNGNRKFILAQIPEQCDENSEAYKAGYKTIADISKERIRRVITKIEKDKAVKQDMFDNGKLDLGFKSFKLSPSNFKIWRGDEITEDNLVTQLDVFANPVKEESKPENMLYELMLKAGYSLTDKVETLAILWDGGERGGEYILNIIADGELIIVLENINDIIVEEILERKPKKIIALDSLFEGNDQLKTNTVLQMKDAGIDFKTI